MRRLTIASALVPLLVLSALGKGEVLAQGQPEGQLAIAFDVATWREYRAEHENDREPDQPHGRLR